MSSIDNPYNTDRSVATVFLLNSGDWPQHPKPNITLSPTP